MTPITLQPVDVQVDGLWRRVLPPNAQIAHWHEEDGTRVALDSLNITNILAQQGVRAPTVQIPHWHQANGTRIAFATLAAATRRDDYLAGQIRELHAQSITALARESATAQHTGQYSTARALAIAAGRLCHEIIGLFPETSGQPGR